MHGVIYNALVMEITQTASAKELIQHAHYCVTVHITIL